MRWAPLVLLFAGAPSAVMEAERLAAEALRLSTERAPAALASARRALALTAEFEPTDFVKPGRKGEVVEDAFQEARGAYRRHRARLYSAVGECLARSGRHVEAARYLRRALDLDATSEARVPLGRSLVALGRGREALDVALGSGPSLAPERLAVAEAAAEALGLPSLQAEIDRLRIRSLPVESRAEFRDGPIHLPERVRLSTGEPLRLDAEGLTLFYAAESACRTCSEDLTGLTRVVPPGSPASRVVMVPTVPDRDLALRQTLQLYGFRWPVLVGPGALAALDIKGPALLIVGRHGWSAAIVVPPFTRTLPPVLAVYGRTDVREAIPRSSWNRRPLDRRPTPLRPSLLPEGLAPGEDDSTPEEFTAAVSAYRGGRWSEALRLFEFLEGRGDGWLLPPEARLNRALCLAGLGQRDRARRLLLQIADSRFQEAVDWALERVAAAPAGPR